MVWRWPGALPVLRPGFSKGGAQFLVSTSVPRRLDFHSRRGVSGSSSGGFLAAAAARGLSGSSSGSFLRRKGGGEKLEDDDDDDEAGLSLSSTGTQRRVLLAKRGEFSRRWGSDPTAKSGEAGGTRERSCRSVCGDDAIDSLPRLVDDGMMGIRSCLRPRKTNKQQKQSAAGMTPVD
jgi:hypothetical protein